MKFDLQLTNVELSKKLYELGVKQDSFFNHYSQSWGVSSSVWSITIPAEAKNLGLKLEFSAYSASELMDILPYRIKIGINDYYLHIEKRPIMYDCSYLDAHDEGLVNIQENLADCIAALLINLIENDYIKIEDINK